MPGLGTDEEATIAELKTRVGAFVDARNWRRFHDGKNLAMSIAIEAAELMEHFQWGERSEYAPDRLSAEQLDEIRFEVADIMIYTLSLCRTMGIDIASTVQAKLEKNERRFPVENSR